MTTIIRRYQRHRLAPLVAMVAAAILLVALLAWLLAIIWIRGGPQRVHEIVIALPAPKIAASAGPRT